jgi:hypothetical protein
MERPVALRAVQWVFPRDYPADLPSPMIETVREVAAGLGVALTDTYEDNHDDVGGGDPRLQVWRFYLRVPDIGQPAGPVRDVDTLTDHWVMLASAWPVTWSSPGTITRFCRHRPRRQARPAARTPPGS